MEHKYKKFVGSLKSSSAGEQLAKFINENQNIEIVSISFSDVTPYSNSKINCDGYEVAHLIYKI